MFYESLFKQIGTLIGNAYKPNDIRYSANNYIVKKHSRYVTLGMNIPVLGYNTNILNDFLHLQSPNTYYPSEYTSIPLYDIYEQYLFSNNHYIRNEIYPFHKTVYYPEHFIRFTISHNELKQGFKKIRLCVPEISQSEIVNNIIPNIPLAKWVNIENLSYLIDDNSLWICWTTTTTTNNNNNNALTTCDHCSLSPSDCNSLCKQNKYHYTKIILKKDFDYDVKLGKTFNFDS